jgi:hypothetical protein
MNTQSSTIVQRLWNYCNVLRDEQRLSVVGGGRVRGGGGAGPRGEAEAVRAEVRGGCWVDPCGEAEASCVEVRV